MLSDVFSDVNGLSWALPELRRVSGALGDKLEQSARGGGASRNERQRDFTALARNAISTCPGTRFNNSTPHSSVAD